MKNTKFLRIYSVMILLFITVACLSSPTPPPGEIITIDNVCDYSGQVLEVAGQLIIPNGVSCSSEEPFTCQLYLEDPFSHETITLYMPVSKEEEIPINHMAALPENYESSDFYVHTSDDKWARNHSFISVRGNIDGGSGCNISNIESITWMERLLYSGMDLKRVTLDQALTEGLVVASITGNGLSRINLTLIPKMEVNLEIEIEPGTMFLSGTEGVQNMVLRQQEIVYLKPSVEVSVELEVSCANMELKQPGYTDVFTISTEPMNEDLVKLLAYEDFLFQSNELQQFAIWTITDNPACAFCYVGIESGGYAHLPDENQIAAIKNMFELVGIDTTKYLVFNN